MIKSSNPLVLENNHIHLLLVSTNQLTDAHWAATNQMIHPTERERANKMLRGKEDYLASRWLTRSALSFYTQIPANELTFERTSSGKPFLVGSDYQFNLSHTKNYSLLAVSKHLPLGVDIELISSTRDLLPIAKNYFHADEYQQLVSLDDAEQTKYFYQLWTLKEAFLKVIGAGISAGLDKISFATPDQSFPRSRESQRAIAYQMDPSLSPETAWQFHQWQLHDVGYLALAYPGINKYKIYFIDPLLVPSPSGRGLG
jgi:4'-phosphopantetheinyl transferase